MIITIDGPAGAGKTTIARALARRLGFRFLAVEPRLRGLGLDSEAVRLVENDAAKRGLAHRFWACVRHEDGLAFYFWLRLGYRPARLDEFAWPEDGPSDIIVLIRTSEDRGPTTWKLEPM